MTHAFATQGDTCPFMPTYGPPAAMFVRGEGSYLWDENGKRHLDFLSGLAVTSLGHAHPDVTEAISDQAKTLLHVSNLFANDIAWGVAKTIDRLNGGGGQIFFANSGAEANECALKLARRFGGRGRHVVVSAYGSFHGRTLATLHATGQPAKHEVFQPLPEGFRHVAWNDLDALEASLSPDVAAVLLEPVQGEGGVNPATIEYFQGVEKLCRNRGILFMVDEVQTGFGRTGAWFGYQHFGVQPDVVTMAKALGNGFPIGACWAKREVAAAFRPGDHATTFGGTPLATAAARAVLEVMERIDAPHTAAAQAGKLTGALQQLPDVVEVRGLGLLIAVELAPLDAKIIAADLLKKGLIVNAVTATALRLAPPITVSDAEINEAVQSISTAIAAEKSRATQS